MKKDYESLKQCPLFCGIEENNFPDVLTCLDARERQYQKGETVFSEGSPASDIGVLLAGKVQIVRLDYYGNRSILTTVVPTQIFGEAFACTALKEFPVDVVAAEACRVLLLNAARLVHSGSCGCAFHDRLLFNLLNIMARKNLVFHRKIEITSKRSTREKLMTCLLMEAKANGSSTVTLPYNRQELAGYLEVDRSGLSAEIGKLRKERVLECHKSTFTLLPGKDRSR